MDWQARNLQVELMRLVAVLLRLKFALLIRLLNLNS